ANVHDLISSGGEAKPLPKSEIKNKAGNVIASQHLRPLFDLLGVCRLQYMELGFEVEHYENLYQSVTGQKKSWDEMLAVSERVWHLTRIISIREIEGYGRHMDYPPARFMNEPVPDGPNKGHCISKPEIEQLLDDYYTARGWDKNGIPTPEKLKEVGLS
ncbi:MAG: aldehyde ferredoxin oxidoreductase, partial [Deltaproteobacteria bacterium]|nr:aldehyde ferredoxin oxidoreductase [Deltaproteobacteria bacterium]